MTGTVPILAAETTPPRTRIGGGAIVAFRSGLVKKWGLAPPPYAYGRENHANARCLSPFFHKLSARECLFRGAKGDKKGGAKGDRDS